MKKKTPPKTSEAPGQFNGSSSQIEHHWATWSCCSVILYQPPYHAYTMVICNNQIQYIFIYKWYVVKCNMVYLMITSYLVLSIILSRKHPKTPWMWLPSIWFSAMKSHIYIYIYLYPIESHEFPWIPMVFLWSKCHLLNKVMRIGQTRRLHHVRR